MTRLSRLLTLALVLQLLVISRADAADPSVGAITPQGGQRGTQLDVQFTGGRLGDALEVMLYEPGIEVKQLEASDAAVKVTLAIAEDCRLGIHAMRIRAASGISNLRTFHVGPLPVMAETEPNSEFTTPQTIPLGTTVMGVVQNEDVDYFLVEAKKGQRIAAEIEGLRLGRTFFDPYVAILNSERFELARSDDAPLLFQDAVCAVAAPDDGQYIIEVRESAYGGNGNCTYRLHVGSFPRPTAVYPPGGQPGQSIEVRWLGDALSEWTQTVQLPGEPLEPFGLIARDDSGTAPSACVFRLNELGNVLEQEPNNQLAEATPFEAPLAACGIIAEPGDVDHFKFTAKKGQRYDIRVHARSVRSSLDPVLSIHRIGGAGVASNDDSGGPDSYVRFQAPEDDEYVIGVRDHLGAGGPSYVYRVEVAPIVPRVTMTLPEWRRYVATDLPVAKGNRAAFLVSAGRADFGGEMAVEINNMPAGVTMETVNMPANRSIVPVLLTAQPDAEVSGTLVDIVGKLADGKTEVASQFSQRTWLVRGANNREVWSHYADRAAMAVTEAVPYSIEIVQPKVPLVQNGSMSLRVVATRAEGFTKPIAIRMLYNPPGVSSSGSISIAEGQNEAAIPLTANSSAGVGKWKIAVVGQSDVGGTVRVASQLAELDVSPPYVKFTFPKVAVEQGQPVDFVIAVENARPFEGAAKVELLGLPAGVTTAPLELAADTKQLAFKVQTSEKSPAGRHKSVLCRAVITDSGEPVIHTLGSGELRIDTPLPAKPDAPKQPAKVAQAPTDKPLHRLDQLRLEREQAKAARGGSPEEAPTDAVVESQE